MINVDKQIIENFPKLKRCDHSPKRDEFIDVSLDPPYFSLDSLVNDHFDENKIRWSRSIVHPNWSRDGSHCLKSSFLYVRTIMYFNSMKENNISSLKLVI